MCIYRVAIVWTEMEAREAKAWFELRGVPAEAEPDPIQDTWAVMSDEEHAGLAIRMWDQYGPYSVALAGECLEE